MSNLRIEAEKDFVGSLYCKQCELEYKGFESDVWKFYYMLLKKYGTGDEVTQTGLESFIEGQTDKLKQVYNEFGGWETIHEAMKECNKTAQEEYLELLNREKEKEYEIDKERQYLIDMGIITEEELESQADSSNSFKLGLRAINMSKDVDKNLVHTLLNSRCKLNDEISNLEVASWFDEENREKEEFKMKRMINLQRFIDGEITTNQYQLNCLLMKDIEDLIK